jgi:beta-galactosidase
VAYKNGKKITNKVETTGVPARITLTPSKNTLLADGEDAVVVNVSVTDDKGRTVPDAGNMIHFALDGNARIIGVGNGDPSSHEADKCVPGAWQRSLFNGHAQLIIQAGDKPGAVVLRATGDGLQAASVAF